MNINAVDLLTVEQKKELSNIAFLKLKEGIESIEFKKSSFDIAKIIHSDLMAYVDNGDGFFGHQDSEKVGKAIADMIVKNLKDKC